MSHLVGLEFHVALDTRRKLFCRCARYEGGTAFHDEEVFCPICMGREYPAEPNAEAVSMAIACANALGCQLNRISLFEHKHYDSPDMPRGYQITQREKCIAGAGAGAGGGLPILRVQLEEDSARRKPDGNLDFSRAGAALCEVVTAAMPCTAAEAADFARHVRDTLTEAGVTSGRMERGAFRVDVNVSVEGGPRCEIKNLASFRDIRAAITKEIARQTALLEAGEAVESIALRYMHRELTALRPLVQFRYEPSQLAPLIIEV